MKKEQKLAFEFGQAASVAAYPFAPCYDPSMRKMVKEVRSKAGHHQNQENMRAWYIGYLAQTALDGNGIPQELFSATISTLIEGESEAISNWIDFAAECVGRGQYVNFVEEKNHTVAVNRWLETLLSSLLGIQKQYGTHIAKQVCNLALLPNCLYPSEMRQAAAHFQSGGVVEEIRKMIESGAIEGEQPFFPKLVGEEGENNSHSPNANIDWPTLEM